MVTHAGTPLAVSIPELARRTGLSEGLLYQMARESRLPGCRRFNSRFAIHLETFEEWLKSGTGDEMGEK